MPFAKIVGQGLREGLPGCSRRPSAVAVAEGTRSGSVSRARSTMNAPSGNDSSASAATRSAQPRLADPTGTGEGHQPNPGLEQEGD